MKLGPSGLLFLAFQHVSLKLSTFSFLQFFPE